MHISNKCSIAVHCLVFIHEYGESHKVTSELLSLSCGCNPVIIRSIMSALKKEGILSVKSGTGGAKLIRLPEEITLYQVCSCLEPDAFEKLMGIHPNPSLFCPVGRNIRSVLNHSYNKVRSDLKESMKSITMKEILEEYRKTEGRTQNGDL